MPQFTTAPDSPARCAEIAALTLSDFQRISGENNSPAATVRDLLGDLMHYCDREEIDFDDLLESARCQHAEELE